MASEPKLWAVFGPDGNVKSLASKTKWGAWWDYGVHADADIRRMKRAGYTCREVRIVPVEEVGK